MLKIYELNKDPILTRQKHVALLKKSLIHLSEPYEVCIRKEIDFISYGKNLKLQVFLKIYQICTINIRFILC